MNKYFQSLTPKGRTIVSIIVVAAVLVGIFFLVKWIRSEIRKRKDRKTSQATVDASQSEYNALLNSGQSLSYPASNYISTANSIQQLLDGCESASSEMDVVEAIITVVRKPVDWAKLKVDFGVREIADCGSFGISKTQYDLPTLLKDQLDSSGFYNININGFSKTGFAFETINVLKDYFQIIGLTI